MSTFNDIDITCESCGDEFRGTVWVAIHAGLDPKLKDLLRGGELNLIACPHCGHVSFQDRFLIYQDPAAELLAYVYPESQRGQETELRTLMLKGFHDAQAGMPEKARVSYEPLLFFGLESLIEQLQLEEALAEQSQVTQVLCKENKLDFELLKPSLARSMSTMRVLPRAGTRHPPTRSEVLEGLDRLLTLNPALDFYARLRKAIQENPGWSLETATRLAPSR